MVLKEMPKVGDKVRHIEGSHVVEVAYYNAWGDAVLRCPLDGSPAGDIAEEDLEYYELVSEGAQNMAQSYVQQRLSKMDAERAKEVSEHMAVYRAEQRQARSGERIVIVDPCEHDSEDYERGDIFIVDKVDSAGVTTTTGNIVYHEEYEVLPDAFAEEIRESMPELPTLSDEEMADAMLDLHDAMKRSEAASFGVSADEAADNAKKVPSLIAAFDVEDGGDNVENPAHYTQGKFETIDIIAHIVAGYDDPFVGHCVGTAVKYVSRAPYKHDTPLEDMRKAKRYIEFAIERLEGER